MTELRTPDSSIIAFRLKRMLSTHSWEELTQISAFREDVEQLITTVLEE